MHSHWQIILANVVCETALNISMGLIFPWLRGRFSCTWWVFFSSSQALKPPSTSLYVPGGAELEGDFQLDVDISGLVFSHHPLFSREHVLGSRLAQLYDHYLTRQHNNLTGHLTDKVRYVLKSGLNHYSTSQSLINKHSPCVNQIKADMQHI